MTEVAGKTLGRAPDRVVALLLGSAARPEVRATLAQGTLDDEARQEAWRLLQALEGLTAGPPVRVDAEAAVRAAWALVVGEGSGGIRRARTTLSRRFPQRAAALYAHYSPADYTPGHRGWDGPQVAGLVRWLDVLDAWEAEAAEPGEAREALAALSRIDVGPDLRARLRAATVRLMLGSDPDPVREALADLPQRRRAVLEQLHGWWKAQSEEARRRISRRDVLVTLGLAERRAPKKG